MAAFVRVQDGQKVVSRLIKNAKYNFYQTSEEDSKTGNQGDEDQSNKKKLEALKSQALKILRTIAGGELVKIDDLQTLLPSIPGIAKTWSCFKAFERAAFEGWTDALQLLLNIGMNPNIKDCKEAVDGSDEEEDADYTWHWREFVGSPLYLAAKAGKLETVQLLLKAGTKIELLNPEEFAGPVGPLEAAAEAGHTAVVKCLLSHGAGSNRIQLNAALRAAKEPDTVKALLNAKADPVDPDCFGVTAIHEAAFCGRLECLSLLVKSSNASSPLSVRTHEGMTPLHAAVISGNKKCISLLLDAGAQIDAKDKLEATPLHYASWRNSGVTSIPLLMKAGAFVNSKDKFGKTPLHYAAEFDNQEIVQALVSSGGNVEAVDKRGRRPRDVLRRNSLTPDKQSFRDIMWLLLNPKGKPPLKEVKVDSKKKKEGEKASNGKVLDKKRPSTADIRKMAIWEIRKLMCMSWRHRDDEAGEDVKCNLPKLKELLTRAPEATQTYSCLKALQECAARGAHDALKVLLEGGASANARACDRWQEDCCPMRAKCDCAARTTFDHNNWSLLHIAARAGHLKAVEVLLEHKASLDQIRVKDQDLPWGPLEAAAEYGENCLPVVQALLRAGAGTDRVQLNSALWHACSPELGRSEGEVGNLKVAQLLLNAGADPNACSWKVLGATAVHGVAYSRWPACLSLLLRRGGNVLARKTDGTTPLHAAARVGNNTEMVTMLISAGADILARDGEGKTPLHHAAGRRGDLESVTALLLAGAEVDARDNTDSTPLHEATKCKYIHCSIISVLLTAGADVNARDSKQRTALHWAALQDSLEGVECLLQAGADKEARDSKGHRPLDMVSRERGNSYLEDIRRKTRHLLGVPSGGSRNRPPPSNTSLSLNSQKSSSKVVVCKRNNFTQPKRKIVKQTPSYNVNRMKRRIADASHTGLNKNVPKTKSKPTIVNRNSAAGNKRCSAKPSVAKIRSSNQGFRNVMSRLLARRSSVYSPPDEGNTPQAKAVETLERISNGQFIPAIRLQAVLSRAPTVATWSACQRTLLKLAYEGRSSLLNVVLEAGGNPNFCREWEALLDIEEKEEEVELVHDLESTGEPKKPDVTGGVKKVMEESTKPKFDYFLPLLDIASSRGHLKTVQVLLEAGATVGPVDKKAFGMPLEPLVGAAEGGHSAVVGLLLKAGAAAGNKEQLNTALRAAANVETVELLLQAGANPNACDSFGSTAVHEAVYCRRSQCLAVLLNHGGNPSLETSMGRTPLHAAALSGSSTCITLLLENGADVNARDNISATALHWAAGRCTGPECVSPLIEGGADINARDKFGRIALHYAVAYGRVSAVKVLLDAGADQEAKDNNGCIPRRMRRRKWDTPEWLSHQNALAVLLRPPENNKSANDGLNIKSEIKLEKNEGIDESETKKKKNNETVTEKPKISIDLKFTQLVKDESESEMTDVIPETDDNMTPKESAKTVVEKAGGDKNSEKEAKTLRRKLFSRKKFNPKENEEEEEIISLETSTSSKKSEDSDKEADGEKEEEKENLEDTKTGKDDVSGSIDLIETDIEGEEESENVWKQDSIKVDNPDMRAEALRELRKIACYEIPEGSGEVEVPWSIDELEELLLEAPSVVRSFTCLRAMQRAAQEGYTEVLHLLLEAGASANASEYHASEEYYLSTDDLLDDPSDDAFFEDDYNLQPLVHIAAGAGNVEAVELLVSAGASLEQDVVLVKGPLEVAVEHVQATCVETLLSEGAAVDRLQLNAALWLAVASNGPCELLAGCNRKSVRLLLDAGADPNAKANPHTGFTALHGAAFSRCDECLPLLLRRGASVAARDAEGRTPLHIAAGVGSVQCVALLCEAGADTCARDDEGRTPLHAACGETGDPLVIEALLRGAVTTAPSLDAQPCQGGGGAADQTGDATRHCSSGADPNVADRSGATPLHLAARWDSALADALLRARADPSRKDKYGNTALHVAAQSNNRSVVDALVAKGANPQAKNNKGQRPCDLAPHLFPATMKALIRASCRSAMPSRGVRIINRKCNVKSNTTAPSSNPEPQKNINRRKIKVTNKQNIRV